jgi:hypothetical protein
VTKARTLAAGLVLGLLMLTSGCALIPGTEDWTIAHVADDLKLDDFGGAQCHNWYRAGFANVGSPNQLTLMIDDVSNLHEITQRLLDLKFELQDSAILGQTEFTRNDVPNPGDYVAARLVEHGPDDAIEPFDFFQNDADELQLHRPQALLLVARIAQELGRALDGAERVLHLVRQARRHLPQRGQAIALLHAPVLPRVVDHHANLYGERLEQHAFVG